jgi:hypothetical protein
MHDDVAVCINPLTTEYFWEIGKNRKRCFPASYLPINICLNVIIYCSVKKMQWENSVPLVFYPPPPPQPTEPQSVIFFTSGVALC